uniref:Chromosome 22 open reading frame 23 n=1 Tax=Coturnix japonica TaxID=93934 RepID=A0A8C2TR57_COTJA
MALSTGTRPAGRGRARYSPETREVLRALMEESKLTSFQRRFLMDCLRRGDSLPLQCHPTSSQEQVLAPPASSPPCHQPSKLPAKPHLRPAEVCRAGDAYIREKFRPQARRDLEREKQRLQNILATGKDTVEHQVKQITVHTKEEEMPELDRFEERTSLCDLEEGTGVAWAAEPSKGWDDRLCSHRYETPSAGHRCQFPAGRTYCCDAVIWPSLQKCCRGLLADTGCLHCPHKTNFWQSSI